MSAEKLLWNVVSLKIALKKNVEKYFVLLPYQEGAVKQQDIFGYGIWVGNYLKTEFVGRGRGMSEKPNGGHRKLDW